MYFWHYAFQVSPQDPHHQHCVFLSSLAEHLPPKNGISEKSHQGLLWLERI